MEIILLLGVILYFGALSFAQKWELKAFEPLAIDRKKLVRKLLNIFRILSLIPLAGLTLVIPLMNTGLDRYGISGITVLVVLVYGSILGPLLMKKLNKLEVVPQLARSLGLTFLLRFTAVVALMVSLGIWLLNNLPLISGIPAP